MLNQFVAKKHLILYFLALMLTWLEAVIVPNLVKMIVESFSGRHLALLWQALIFGVLGNLILLLGLLGKRYYFACLQADFQLGVKQTIFRHFLYGNRLFADEVLACLENDVKQLEETYLEPTVIIMSSLGFTTVSIIYALVTNFWLGLIFIVFYALPALCSSIGAKRLDMLAEKKSQVNEGYLANLTNMLAGHQVIKHYQAQDFFFRRYQTGLTQVVNQYLSYEKQRTRNSFFINSIDLICSICPLIIGGVMTFYGYLSGAEFIAIYLVSYNIGYQFQELSYFINTRQSSKKLVGKYKKLWREDLPQLTESLAHPIFPIELKQVSLCLDGRQILKDFSCRIEQGDKVAIIGESGVGKSSLLNLIYGQLQPDSGQVLYHGCPLTNQELAGQISYILQDSYCFTGLTLVDNIVLGSFWDEGRLKTVLEQTKLTALLDKTMSNDKLSGGEKQRLEIARSLYHNRPLILADEIKSNLDKANAQLVEDLLFSLPQTLVEVIHHYSDESLARYHQVLELKK